MENKTFTKEEILDTLQEVTRHLDDYMSMVGDLGGHPDEEALDAIALAKLMYKS